MKDYYRILQVDPQAEQEVIEAAYRRLIRKYHPDVLSAEERDSEDVLRKVQELNEAYEILGDIHKRREYDLQRIASKQYPSTSSEASEPFPLSARADVEIRRYLVRCSTTKRTFKMLLGRRKNWSGPFVVLGFEPIDDGSAKPIKVPGIVALWRKLQAILANGRRASPVIKEALPSPEETILNLFDLTGTLSMGEIEWAGHKCPDCAAEIVNPSGTISTWIRCGTCHRLKCAGNAKRRIDGIYSTCPWCGATNKITHSVPTGSKEQFILRGKYDEGYKQDTVSLPKRNRNLLRGKKTS
jgi:hypothetical protein